jgi:hypothetical protein
MDEVGMILGDLFQKSSEIVAHIKGVRKPWGGVKVMQPPTHDGRG